MKKVMAFISVLLTASAVLFADISVKKLDDGSVEATFFYGNPRATEVLIAGDFTNWQEGALPMEKGEKGFTLVKTFPKGTTVKYKFIVDGSWTTDLKAPDFVDDGFGGKNSCGDLDALAGGGDTAPKSGLKFLTWTMFGGQAKWRTDDDKAQEIDKGLESAGINLKSYIKVTGNALPNVPMYLEVAVAEQDTFDNIYKQDSLKAKDGSRNFGSGLLFAPVHTLNGEKTEGTYLGHFKFGIDTMYVSWQTGYKYAKLPPHSINGWITVDKEWEAGYKAAGGYNYFELGPALQNLGPLQVKAGLSPNKTADRAGNQYGFFGWFNIFAGPALNFDFQYNTALGKTYDTIFGHCYEQDFIFGYKGIFGPLTLTTNYLMNRYGDGDLTKLDGVTYYSKFIPAASDVGEVSAYESGLTNMAGNAQLAYSDENLPFDVTLGARFRGAQAGMMYVEEGADEHTNVSDNLGKKNHWRAWLDTKFYATDAITFGLIGRYTTALNKEEKNGKLKFKTPYNNKDTVEYSAVPSVEVDFEELLFVPAKVRLYGDMSYFSEKEDEKTSAFGKSQLRINAIGLGYDHNFNGDVLKTGKAMYCMDNTDDDYLFNTLLTTWNLANDWGVQGGFGLRSKNKESTKDDPKNPFGFYIGGFKKLSVLAKPTAYLQFMYAMDPYQKFGDGPTAYRLSTDYDYATKDGVSRFKENYAVRMGLQWDI